MSILVTGAAGFIGCNNVLELNRRGFKDVIAVDNLTKSEKFLNLAKCSISDYFDNFPAISAYINDVIAATREKGYVETLFGRRRYIADINSRNGSVRAIAERNAVNAPVQGSAADIIKLAMIAVDSALGKEGLRSKMILQIHDELLLEVPLDELERVREILIREMEGVTELSVPLTVECNYGKNWLDAH